MLVVKSKILYAWEHTFNSFIRHVCGEYDSPDPGCYGGVCNSRYSCSSGSRRFQTLSKSLINFSIHHVIPRLAKDRGSLYDGPIS